MKTPLRSFFISLAVVAMSRIQDLQAALNPHPDIRWTDHLCWFLEGLCERLFCLAWEGSQDEYLQALRGEIPWEYYSDKQKAMWLENHGVVFLDDYGYPTTEARPRLLLTDGQKEAQ